MLAISHYKGLNEYRKIHFDYHNVNDLEVLKTFKILRLTMVK